MLQPRRKLAAGLSLLMLVPLVILLSSALQILGYSLQCIQFPYQLDPEEGFLLHQAMELSQGRNFYRPLTEYPFVAGTYAPLFQLLNAVALKFHNPSLAPGRIITLISALSIALSAGWIIFYQTRRLCLAVACPFFFLVSYELTHWIGFYRVDLPAIALSMAGLALLFGRKRDAWSIYGAGVCFLLTGYTKQIQLAGPLAATLYFIFTDRRVAWWLAVVWIGGGALIFLLANIVTRGQFFIHTVTYNANEFAWEALFNHWLPHLKNFYIFEIVAGLMAALGYAECVYAGRKAANAGGDSGNREENNEDQAGEDLENNSSAGNSVRPETGFFILYAAINMLYIIGIAKIGAAANYVLEPLAACALMLGVAIGHLLNETDRRPRSFYISLVIYILIVLSLTVHAFQLTAWQPQFNSRKVLLWKSRVSLEPERILADRQEAENARRLIAREGERVYCELPVLSILSQKPVFLQSFILSRLSREGKWDQSAFVEDLRQGRFKYLIMTMNAMNDDPQQGNALYTAEMIQAIQNRYTLIRSFERTGLFRYYYFQRKDKTP